MHKWRFLSGTSKRGCLLFRYANRRIMIVKRRKMVTVISFQIMMKGYRFWFVRIELYKKIWNSYILKKWYIWYVANTIANTIMNFFMFNFLLKFTICLRKHLISYFVVLFNCFIILNNSKTNIIYKNVLLNIFLTFFS